MLNLPKLTTVKEIYKGKIINMIPYLSSSGDDNSPPFSTVYTIQTNGIKIAVDVASMPDIEPGSDVEICSSRKIIGKWRLPFSRRIVISYGEKEIECSKLEMW